MKSKTSKAIEFVNAPPGEPSEDAIGEIVEIIRLMSESQLAEIFLETPDLKLSLSKFGKSQAQTTITEATSQPSPAQSVATLPRKSLPRQKEKSEIAVPLKVYHKILSPMAGTFYRAPSAASKPYINEGDRVTVGMPICIVEAMKLMNEIKADKAGKIVKIHIENAQPLEKGTVLFEIDTEATG